MNAHDLSFAAIDGAPLPLGAYRGRPVLVVNTASYCGFTPQYAELETLWRRYRDRGLVVIAVPSNDFGAQEPGTAEEINSFCTTRYAVDFPIAAKAVTLGGEAHPFFRWIVEEAGEGAAPRWNFHKYLIGPDGDLIDVWPSRTRPLDPAIIAAIEPLLAPLTA
jgi:glutathione peroxidase